MKTSNQFTKDVLLEKSSIKRILDMIIQDQDHMIPSLKDPCQVPKLEGLREVQLEVSMDQDQELTSLIINLKDPLKSKLEVDKEPILEIRKLLGQGLMNFLKAMPKESPFLDSKANMISRFLLDLELINYLKDCRGLVVLSNDLLMKNRQKFEV